MPVDWKFPSTRYQGSKRKLLPWIYKNIEELEFESALDIFGGTGVVSYLFKKMDKCVTYSDYLKCNTHIGEAIIENDVVVLSGDDLRFLFDFKKSQSKTSVEDTFKGIYYTDEENRWIDCLVENIHGLDNRYSGLVLRYKKAMAYYALFESCIIKRPFNLFHRSNLSLRTAEVSRSFGNKKVWDTPFEVLFRRFTEEANGLVFSNGKANRALNQNAFEIEDVNYDLVYIDPPYFSKTRTPIASDYKRMYHFIEGIAQYDDWPDLIDYESSNLHLKDNHDHWPTKSGLVEELDQLFSRFANSVIVFSYKSPGVPTEEELTCLISKYKKNVSVKKQPYSYALNKSNGKPHQNIELLIIGQ